VINHLVSYSFKKGNIPWNKGIKKQTNSGRTHFKKGMETSMAMRKKRSLITKARWESGQFKGITGTKQSATTRAKISNALRGENAPGWKGGLPACKTCNKRLSVRKKTGYCFNCYVNYARETGIYYEMAQNSMKKRGISKLEKKVLSIMENNNLPYKYVGDGNFSINKKVPDFINTNGQKIAVEVYYEGHKEHFRGGVKAWQKERENIFKEYGWQIVFIPEYKATEEYIVSTLKGGYLH